MDIWKSKMDAIYKTDKSNLQSLAWWEYSYQDDDLFTSDTTICSQAMILFTVVKYIFNSFFGHQGGSDATDKWSYHVGKINMAL